MTSLPNVHY